MSVPLHEERRSRVALWFLQVRPKIALVGACANAAILAASPAPIAQRASLLLAFGATIAAFFLEARWLDRRALSPRHLATSLSLTLVALGLGASLSGGIASPLSPLLFAPVVVAFAAFARSRTSAAIFALAVGAFAALALFPPIFGAPPRPWSDAMTVVSATMALVLGAAGVIGLVDAHAKAAEAIDRMREDALREAERRAASVELLGARVAHEVKNPLTSVRGLVQLVARRVEDARDRERLDVAVAEVDRALEHLHAYLGFSRPIVELARAPTELLGLLGAVAEIVEARSSERGVVVSVEGAATTVEVDRRRLEEALLNLALNAIRAMPAGGKLTLGVEATERGARISVNDTGEGMSAEQLARLGAPFESEAGTGLGVLIARGLVEQHGGRLRFESEPGRGTRALIEL